MRLRSLAAVLLSPLTLTVQAQKTPPHPIPHAAERAPAPPRPAALPVTSVSLYKNGVGFFEHTGHVNGDASVNLDFTSSQLNDVLQSLTAIDLNGGRISGAIYNSTTPLDQQLKTLPLSLSEDPTAADFYTSIRGARVDVHFPGGSIAGRLLSIELRSIPAKDGDDTKPGLDHEFLTIVSDSGEVRTLEVTPATSVRLLDTGLQQNVDRYLQLLDSTRSQGLRHLTLEDRGSGSRELRVSYISEVPIWKSTYRILFTQPGTPGAPSIASSAMGGDIQTATIQGWSVVDNTTGVDWINVHLSLLAGAPQSFIQPLSQPIYSRRPEIPIAQEDQLTPQTFDSSIDAASVLKEDASPSSFAASPTGGPVSNQIAVNGRVADRFSGGGPARISGGVMGGITASNSGSGYAYAVPPPPPPTYEESAATSLAPNATSAAFDDFFAYHLTDPVTILKNQSALVPILQTKVPADSVSLVSYNSGHVSQPLRALWLTNSSGLTLDRGSFTVIESGNFAGEGLLDTVHPDEKRLISYAADQAVHVTTEGEHLTNHVTLIHGTRGVVNIHRADIHEVTLVMHNAAPTRRSVVSEFPVVAGWNLDSDPKPVETTATVYRFRSEVDPGATVRLHVGATHSGYTTYYLTRSDDNQIEFLLSETGNNSALQQALAPVIEARRKVADAQAAVDQTKAKLDTLHSDEERQRANITALQNADHASRERFVNDLNHTEDQITAAQTELNTRTAALDAAKAELADRIEAVQIDEHVSEK